MSTVLVIGGGLNGLVAASYLARSGHTVNLAEAEAVPGGMCANRVPLGDLAVAAGPHLFSALDPKMLDDLAITLAYTERDLPLIGLREGEKPLILPRDGHTARAAIAPWSERDASRFGRFRREHQNFARAMRALWWEDGAPLEARVQTQLRQAQVLAATTWLDGAFETEALRAIFAFDALSTGLSPAAAGSALLYTWRAAQEMSGLQGAIALPSGGPQPLIDALVTVAEAAGVRLRCEAKVSGLLSDGERVRGATLESGEEIAADAVLSSLSRRQTLTGLLPPGHCGFALTRSLETPEHVGEAKVLLGLSSLPPLFAQPGRYILAERIETVAMAQAEARSRHIPSDLALEVVAVPSGGSPLYILSILVRPVPVEPLGGWKEGAAKLVQAVMKRLEVQVPRLLTHITSLAFVPPRKRDAFALNLFLAPWRARIETPLKGLYLCGEAAEPVPALSGRAGRIAAAMVHRVLTEARS